MTLAPTSGKYDRKRVKQLFRIVTGSTPKSDDPRYWGNAIPWVTPEDLGRLRKQELTSTLRSISHEGLMSCATTLSPAGSLVLSTRAPIGHVASAAMDFAINQGCRALVPQPGVFAPFYRYVLSTRRPFLQALGRGSTFQELSTGDLGNVIVPTPPHEHQRTIVRFLDEETAKVDALIEKKQQLRESLRSLIRTKLRVRLEDETSAGDLVSLKRIALFVTSGSRGWAAHYADHGENFIRIGNLSSDTIELDLRNVQKVVPPDGAEARRTLARTGDVLVSITALIGAIGIVPAGLTGYVNQHLALVRPDPNKVDSRWVALCLFSDVGQRQFRSALYGGTKQGLGLDDVREMRLPVPSIARQRLAVEKVGLEMEQSAHASEILLEGIRRLKEYRQALITAAVTGQIDVAGAA